MAAGRARGGGASRTRAIGMWHEPHVKEDWTVSMDGTLGFALLRVWHSCGHCVTHSVAARLNQGRREVIAALLTDQPCWNCVIEEAWAPARPPDIATLVA